MKAAIVFIFCVALIEGGIGVHAEDTPNQAAARAALEQKLYQLDHPAASPPPITNSAAPETSPAESATNDTGVASTNAPTLSTAPGSTPPPDAVFDSEVPADNTSAQTAALAALNEKMSELNHSEVQAPSDTNSLATMATTPAAVPVREASAAATPVTEMPAAETPTARVPVAASAAVVPASVAPAVVTPAPKVSSASAAAAAVPTGSERVLMFPFSSPGQVRPANKLVTTTGAIYKSVEVQKVVADGIVISYTPAHGGWARTKVPFRDLPPEIRRQYEK